MQRDLKKQVRSGCWVQSCAEDARGGEPPDAFPSEPIPIRKLVSMFFKVYEPIIYNDSSFRSQPLIQLFEISKASGEENLMLLLQLRNVYEVLESKG